MDHLSAAYSILHALFRRAPIISYALFATISCNSRAHAHHGGDGDVFVGRMHLAHARAEDAAGDAVLGVDVAVGAAAAGFQDGRLPSWRMAVIAFATTGVASVSV